MTSYICHKLLAALAVALLLATQAIMGFMGKRDLFPFFTWSLYSYANTNITVVPTIEITAIDGQKTPADVLSAYRGTIAFAQRVSLAQAVGREDEDRAREVLRGMLRAAGVPFNSEVELNVHFNRVRLTEYLRKGEVVSQRSLSTKIERL